MRRLLPILLILSAACSFDDFRRAERCERDEQCAPDVCRDGLCVFELDLSSPALDVGRDAVPPPLDQRPPEPSVDMRPPPPDRPPPPPMDAEIDQAVPEDAEPPPPVDAAVPLPLPAGQAIPLCDIPGLITRCWRPTDDTYADEGEPDDVYGAEDTLEARHRRDERKLIYLRFDLSPFAGRRRPDRCDVSLLRTNQRGPGDPRWLVMRRAETGWWEGGLSWQFRPGTIGDLVQREAVVGANIVQRFSVGGWMNDALDAGADAVAFRVEAEAPPTGRMDWSAEFHSLQSDGLDGDARPYLSCQFDAP